MLLLQIVIIATLFEKFMIHLVVQDDTFWSQRDKIHWFRDEHLCDVA